MFFGSALVESCIANVDNDLDNRPMNYALRVTGSITATLNRAGGNVGESDLISLTVKSKVGDNGSIEVVSPLTIGDNTFLVLVAIAARIDPI